MSVKSRLGKKKSLTCVTDECHFTTPIGMILSRSCKGGIHTIDFMDEKAEDTFQLTRCEVIRQQVSECLFEPSICIETWMTTYFDNPGKVDLLDLGTKFCFSISKDSFFHRVYVALYDKVKSGQVVSYKELATLAGSPGAVRAVGTAMATNPISLIIPCHRVIKSDGSLGNYSGGKRNAVKKWLLDYEKSFKPDGIQLSTKVLEQLIQIFGTPCRFCHRSRDKLKRMLSDLFLGAATHPTRGCTKTVLRLNKTDVLEYTQGIAHNHMFHWGRDS